MYGQLKIECSSIGGIKDNWQIADNFTKQYKQLFNSNPLNPEDRRTLIESLCTKIRTNPKSVSDCCVIFKHMKDAIKCEEKRWCL